MATPKKPPEEHKSAGRPRTTPEGTRNRTIRCTDAEYDALMSYLRGTLRAAEKVSKTKGN